MDATCQCSTAIWKARNSRVGNSDYLALKKPQYFSSRWKFLMFGLEHLCWKWSAFLELSPWKQFSLCWIHNGSLIVQQTSILIFKVSSKGYTSAGESHPRCVEDRSSKWVFQAACHLDQLVLSCKSPSVSQVPVHGPS